MTRAIDCDVHCGLPPVEALIERLPGQWSEFVAMRPGVVRPPDAVKLTYPAWLPMLGDRDVTLERVQGEVLDRAELAVMHCYFGVESFTHPYLAASLATAVNDWVREEWLDREPRLLASAVITPQHTAAAVEEVHRIAQDDRFVQILVSARAAEGYGQQRYWPIWEAAASHSLGIALTYGGVSGTPPTPVGWLSSFWEHYSTAPVTCQSHLLSLVASGIFKRLPDLRVTVLESGWTWLPGLLWRFDEHWRGLHREVPWLDERPSAAIRRHFRFTTQPLDAPSDARQLRYVVDQIGGAGLLLQGSDFPHRYEEPDLLREALTESERDGVDFGNAVTWLGLDERVAARS
jgi:predicted TIM-barrel fold metal-dependent hydrolase